MSFQSCGKRGKYTFREVVHLLRKDPKAQADPKSYIVKMTNPEMSSFIDLLQTLFEGVVVPPKPHQRLKRENFCENLNRILNIQFPDNDDLLRALKIPPLTAARKKQIALVEKLVIPSPALGKFDTDFYEPLLEDDDDRTDNVHMAATDYLRSLYKRAPTAKEVEAFVHTGKILDVPMTPRSKSPFVEAYYEQEPDLEDIYEQVIDEGYDEEDATYETARRALKFYFKREPVQSEIITFIDSGEIVPQSSPKATPRSVAKKTPVPKLSASRQAINELTDKLIKKAQKAGYGTKIQKVATPEELEALGYSRAGSMIPTTPPRDSSPPPKAKAKAKATRSDKVYEKTLERMRNPKSVGFAKAFEQAQDDGMTVVHFIGWCCEGNASNDKVWIMLSNDDESEFATMWGKSGGTLSYKRAAKITNASLARNEIEKKKKGDGYKTTQQSRLYQSIFEEEGFMIL